MNYKFLFTLVILAVVTPLYYSSACNVSNCYSCNPLNTNQCLICNSGYKTSSWKCTKAGSTTSCKANHCMTCVIGSTTRCLICISGYKGNSLGNCIPTTCNYANCAYCATDRNVCTRWKLDYFVSLFYCVSKCSSTRCLTCFKDSVANENRCKECLPGYTYNSGKNIL